MSTRTIDIDKVDTPGDVLDQLKDQGLQSGDKVRIRSSTEEALFTLTILALVTILYYCVKQSSKDRPFGQELLDDLFGGKTREELENELREKYGIQVEIEEKGAKAYPKQNLNQEKAEEVGTFLEKENPQDLVMSDFSFHSIAVIMTRLNESDALNLFVDDLFGYGGIVFKGLGPIETKKVTRSIYGQPPPNKETRITTKAAHYQPGTLYHPSRERSRVHF